MVGDREHDIPGAREVGIPVIGVTWGYGTADELLTAGADRLVAHVTELADAVQSLK